MAPSEARRDRWGRYLVVPPGGTRPVGYTRATTVAKVLDDQGGLMPWKAAMALTGMMRRPGLRGRVEALVSAHPEAGPWYGSDESKKAIKALVEECAEAGGSADRADIGTALHAIVEQINRGEPATISQDSTRADVDAYRAKLAEYGITFHAEHIEATVVLDEYQVAGTADGGAVHIPGLAKYLRERGIGNGSDLDDVVADLKTGTRLDYSGQAIAVQLAIYGHGDAHYRQGPNGDGSDDVRLPAPKVRTDVAVVIHLPAGEARCELHMVDIAAGWEAFKSSIWAREWRKRKDLLVPLTLEPIAADATVAEVAVDGAVSAMDATRLTLLELIGTFPEERRAVLRDSWPATLPPLKNAAHWTPALLVDATRFIGAVASGGAPVVEVAETVTPGDTTTASPFLSADQWGALDPAERADRVERGQLPPELRVSVEQLEAWRVEANGLPAHQQAWLVDACKEAGLPSLAHQHFWTFERGAMFRDLLGQASAMPEPVVHDFPALVAEHGLTKASVQRQAKAIAAELDIKVPATIERLPSEGVFADRLAEWIVAQSAERASAA